MTLEPILDMEKQRNASWYEKFLRQPDYELTLEEYIGPFPVGPKGYREKDVEYLRDMFENEREMGLPNVMACYKFCNIREFDVKELSSIRFLGVPDNFLMFAYDDGKLISMMTPSGTYRDQSSDVKGTTTQMHRILSASGSKSYVVVDFSIAGFYARRNAHALILEDALRSGHEISSEVMKDYQIHDGKFILIRDYGPDEHNGYWDVSPNESYYPKPQENDEPCF